jgi:hypothetical protein
MAKRKHALARAPLVVVVFGREFCRGSGGLLYRLRSQERRAGVSLASHTGAHLMTVRTRIVRTIAAEP